jgi:hypothetical protein
MQRDYGIWFELVTAALLILAYIHSAVVQGGRNQNLNGAQGTRTGTLKQLVPVKVLRES